MSRDRTIYNVIGVFAGLVPSDAPHFIDASGYLVNSQYSITGNITGYSSNTIKSLNRIQSASYSFGESRTDISNMGAFGTIARPILITPPVSLNLSYYSHGVYNEYLLGLTISSGINITAVSGFLDRTYNPNIFTDRKNIFIATNDSNLDLNFIQPERQSLNGTTGDTLKNNIHVYAFGDVYMDAWKYSAAVGQFPQANASFISSNIIYYSGGSGQNIPSVNAKDFTIKSGILYNLPPVYTGIQPSVLLPGDITTSITEVGGTNYIQNLPIEFRDIKLQSFDIDLSLRREPLTNLGYRTPLDRPINAPIFANLSMSTIVGDSETGSLINFINNDTNYNINIDLRYSQKQPIQGIGANFKFLKAKFNGISISESIDQKRLCNFSFTSELNPAYSDNGFYISGQIGDSKLPIVSRSPSYFLLSGTGVSYSEIDLTWTQSNSSLPVTYSLYRSTGIGFLPLINNQIVSDLTSLNYNDINLNSSTTYYYYAKAFDSNGLSIISNEASGTTLSRPPIISGILPSVIGQAASIVPFSIDVSGQYFTNNGNETFYLSGYTPSVIPVGHPTNYFGDIVTGLISYTGDRLVSVSFTGVNNWPNASTYSTNYINNNGKSNNDVLLQINPCVPPTLLGFYPSGVSFFYAQSGTGFYINFKGNNFTNKGNESLTLISNSESYSGEVVYYDSHNITAYFQSNTGKYGIGQYTGYYINDCSHCNFSGFYVDPFEMYHIYPNPAPDGQTVFTVFGTGFREYPPNFNLYIGIAVTNYCPIHVVNSQTLSFDTLEGINGPFVMYGGGSTYQFGANAANIDFGYPLMCLSEEILRIN